MLEKNIALIIAFRNFRDKEYFEPRDILEKTGAKITIVSTAQGEAIGADGGRVKVDAVLDNLDINQFDAFVFIGGPGALQYLDNEKSYLIIRQAVSQNKVLAAICIAPLILARAGVLQGRKATVWTGPEDKWPLEEMCKLGVLYEEKPVVIDNNIITANGPSAAQDFSLSLIEKLKI